MTGLWRGAGGNQRSGPGLRRGILVSDADSGPGAVNRGGERGQGSGRRSNSPVQKAQNRAGCCALQGAMKSKHFFLHLICSCFDHDSVTTSSDQVPRSHQMSIKVG